MSAVAGSGDPRREDVAIVGMACIFPGAGDLASYWENIVTKVDAVGAPPEDWDAGFYYDPDAADNDRTYCLRGGYLGELARFDPLRYGVMPNSIDGGEPDHFLALRVACEALEDAGFPDGNVGDRQAAVILGRGTYVNRGYTTLVQHGMVVDQTLRLLQQLHPEHTQEELRALKRRLKASLPPFNAEVAPGLVPNIVSGRIANRLDFMGPNYLVDAACASSLIAVDRGMQDLRAGRCDLAVVGGVHASTPALIHMIFSQLGALSRRGEIRPFDREADGTLLGEGVGIVVLKRTEDAERDGDRIYAVIRGVGVASDGRALGLLAPRVDGEEMALRSAYALSGVEPGTLGLIEAHGTGTPVGDATEIQALASVFPSGEGIPAIALGTVKSMISHLLPAAGIAGLIKAALAVYHRVLPPTLHCDQPHPGLDLASTPFYLNTETRPWIHGGPHPRRAGVNAFGFGGINAHAVLEEHGDGLGTETLLRRWDAEVCVLDGDSPADLAARADRLLGWLGRANGVELYQVAATLGRSGADRPAHLAIVASSLEDLRRKLEHALRLLRRPACSRIRDRSGIYFTADPLAGAGRLAVLFPGEGSQSENMLADVCLHFPRARAWFDLMDRAFAGHRRGALPSQVVYPPPGGQDEDQDRRLWRMDHGAEAVFTANQALYAVLTDLGLCPDSLLGHSTGEYSALLASGALSVQDDEELIHRILQMHDVYRRAADRGEIPQAHLVSVGGIDRDAVLAVLAQGDGSVSLAMDNCPHQMVLCGQNAQLAAATAALRRQGAVCATLPFARAYHTPLFRPIGERLRQVLADMRFAPPTVPLYSCATASAYPRDPQDVRELAARQWTCPVRFRETIEAMYDDGHRIFVEAGPKGALTAFVDDILRERPHLAFSAGTARGSGTRQLCHLIAQLTAHGVPLQLDRLWARRSPRLLDLSGEPPAGPRRSPTEIRLAVGLQQLTLSDMTDTAGDGTSPPPAQPADRPAPVPAPEASPPVRVPALRVPDPAPADRMNGGAPVVMQAYLNTMDRFLAVQATLMSQYLDTGAAPADTAPARAAAPAAPEAPATMDTPDTTELPAAEPPLLVAEMPSRSSAAEPAQRTTADVAAILLELVAERTGYPPDALQLGDDLEGKLGIDSIKRVEILAAFQRRTGLLPPNRMEEVLPLRTLQEVAAFLADREPAAEPSAPAPEPAVIADAVAGTLPLAGEIVSAVPGRELVTVRRLDPARDVFLADHTLGRRVSTRDPSLTALAVMPLTMSMEMLAEAAAQLAPGNVVVRLTDLRAHRWITLDTEAVTLRLTARLRRAETRPDDTLAVDVDMQDARSGVPVVQGTVVLAPAYPPAPAAGTFPLDDERSSRWAPADLYSQGMFHGPSFQGVTSVERTGSDGTEATLVTLPGDRLFSPPAAAPLLIDPVLLDAAGQLVGYWTAEHLPTGFNVFPFRLGCLHRYGDGSAPGTRIVGRARIRLIGDDALRSDIDLVSPDGTVLARLEGWEDRRFELPAGLYGLRVAPARTTVSAAWPEPVRALAEPGTLACCLLNTVPAELLRGHGGIWGTMLAHLALGREERSAWRALDDDQRDAWLLSRVAAKDAVRHLVRAAGAPEPLSADVLFAGDPCAEPVRVAEPLDALASPPLVTVALSGSVAVALAADPRRWSGTGVCLRPIVPASPATRADPEWAARVRAALEAVRQAAGAGTADTEVRAADRDTGTVTVAVGAGAGSGDGAECVDAWTACLGGLAVACAVR